jgi:hypothetical protein
MRGECSKHLALQLLSAALIIVYYIVTIYYRVTMYYVDTLIEKAVQENEQQ